MPDRPSFINQLQAKWAEGKSVCVGLDADYLRIPTQHLLVGADLSRLSTQVEFLTRIIDATADLVCAYKPNIAFFEDAPQGLEALEQIVTYIHRTHPDIPVIGDVKRADIGNTNRGYASMAFDRFGFDAITTNPYFGGDTFPPFQAYENKGLIVLCRTTNPGSKELQDMPIHLDSARETGLLSDDELHIIRDTSPGLSVMKVYEMVAFFAANRWNANGQLGLVVGATHPEAFEPVRRLAPNVPFLIPGIGTQLGDLAATLRYAPDSKGHGIIINSSSGIIFASKDEDFAEAARAATLKLHNQITDLRIAD